MNRVATPAGTRLTERQRLAWLRLIRSDNVGPATFRALINHFGTAEAAIEGLPDLARRSGGPGRVRVRSRSEAEREMEAVARLGAQLVGLGEPGYPPWLRQADAPPPLLTVLGSLETLARPAAAVVGARNASAAGRKMAATLSRELGEAGLLIVSGFARGIDSAAHEASLTHGTAAVFAGGVDVVYPPENAPLLDRIIQSDGAALTEMPVGWEPRARDFPRRNRIIAGMSVAVIVVEAAERSGSLITARLALEQNREVMAVPGSPLDPRAGGSNRLLKQGARLVTEAEDVLEAVRPLLAEGALPPPPPEIAEPPNLGPPEDPSPSERSLVVEALGPTPVEIDEVIRQTGLSARSVHVLLLELDLAGRLERHPGQRVSLT